MNLTIQSNRVNLSNNQKTNNVFKVTIDKPSKQAVKRVNHLDLFLC